MELPLLIVESVQDVLEVTDLGELGCKVVEQSLMIKLDAIGCIFIDVLSILEEASLLDLFVAKQLLEELVIAQLEERVEGGEMGVFFGLEVGPQVAVEEDLALEMSGETGVVGLEVVNNLPQLLLVTGVLEELFDEEVKDAVALVELLHI